jgi:hypothetical protein
MGPRLWCSNAFMQSNAFAASGVPTNFVKGMDRRC